ncbi:membrane protein [Alcaligenes pakistanensis]|uniref:Membrane protein n=1 Tax=Alcaligenes pakistanensis TaxID=1482717 RepID=A0A8H9IFF8_9BURK|nr:MipA/OmpV family protein [Alcaligenes pakistanensis]GHC39109.1 membrane protein [Alcaligenes pakistanensis]HCA18569.1 MipA/OmpV family protein [Alcaligenes faecalis]
MPQLPRSALRPCLLLALCVIGSSQALAQQTTIGLGMGFAPKYEGSDSYSGRAYPLISHRNGHFFLAPKAGMPAIGLQTQLTDNWTIGTYASLSRSRDAGDGSRLHGTDDIDRHGNLGVFTAYQLGDAKIEGSYYQALKSGYGATAVLDLSYRLWNNQDSSFSVGTELKWSNEKAMRTYFGVQSHEVVNSGGQLRTYRPDSGLRSYALYGQYTHKLSESWSLQGLLGVNTLGEEAKDSPLVEKKSSVFGGVGLGYSF